MTHLKFQVRDQLANAPGAWLTVAQLVVLIPAANGRDATVARALRKLRSEGHVAAQPVPGNGRYRQWSYTNSSSSAPTRSSRTSRAVSVPTPATIATPASLSKGRVPMTTFQNAIESIVNEFVAAQKTFSAFDITQELRERSNAGTTTIDPAETGTCHVNGGDVPRINHDQVRDYVHDLFANGKMSGYDRSNNGQYWQYGPAASIPDPDPSAAPASSGSNGTPPSTDGSSYDGNSTL